MFVRGFALCGALLAACAGPLEAQAVAPPTAYTVTEINSFFGPPQTVKTYRLGPKVLIDQIAQASAADPKAAHMRTFNDLQTHKSLSWSSPGSSLGSSPGNSSGCSAATFSGDWGDPFAAVDELTGPNAKQVGTEKILGFAAKIVEASGPDARIKAWVDAKSGLVLKVQVSQADRPLSTVIEVTDVSLDPPPASVFAIPPDCAGAVAPPTEDEKLAALTGGNPQDYAEALHPPASKDSCAMVFRVVQAGTMAPIASGFQVGVDLDVATEPTPSYVMGVTVDGRATFSGGGLHAVTSELRDGVLRIDNVPDRFELEMAFGAAGWSSGLIYRQCFAPQTVLLFVVKNPAKLSDGGEWLWVKSGKYAAIPK